MKTSPNYPQINPQKQQEINWAINEKMEGKTTSHAIIQLGKEIGSGLATMGFWIGLGFAIGRSSGWNQQ